MEGIPRMPMIVPEVKPAISGFSSELFETQLKEYILMNYQVDPMKYSSAVFEMITMRERLTKIIPDADLLVHTKRYYAQLLMMKSRFPMEGNDLIQIPFMWYDKASDVPNIVSLTDINYEIACVLYNIGIIHAKLAANEERMDPESIKSAFTHFQWAAYPLQHIRETMHAKKYSAADFESSTLKFYTTVFLAQAQECILEKSLIDHRKHTVIAKIAIYLRDLYKQCAEIVESSALIEVLSSTAFYDIDRLCDIKSEIYGAVAMVQLGEQADLDKKMGLRLAYYQVAANHMRNAIKIGEKDKRETVKQVINFMSDIVIGKETNATKENDFIYHEKVSKADELQYLEGICLVKPIEFDPSDPAIAGPDLFAGLVPGKALKIVSLYSEEKAKLKRSIMREVDEKDSELNEYLLSMQLDEIRIDESVDEMELPEMLLERNAAFVSNPDSFPDLLDKLKLVGSRAIEADNKLDDLTTRLSNILSPDLKADEGFIAVKAELERICDHHKKARANNNELQKAIAAHSEFLKLLAMPLNELNRRLSGPVIKPRETAEGAQLKRVIDKVTEMHIQRKHLVERLTNELDEDDITQKCLQLKNNVLFDLYVIELKKHDELVSLIRMNLSAQAKILSTLIEANASFADYRRQLMKLNESRTQQILALTTAYDVYTDVLTKTDDGINFYSTLLNIVHGLEQAVEGIEQAYKEEKEEKARKRGIIEILQDSNYEATRDSIGQARDENCDVFGQSIRLPISDAEQLPNQGPKLKDYLIYYRQKKGIPLSSTQSEGTIQNAFARPHVIQQNTNGSSKAEKSKLPHVHQPQPRPLSSAFVCMPLQQQMSSVTSLMRNAPNSTNSHGNTASLSQTSRLNTHPAYADCGSIYNGVRPDSDEHALAQCDTRFDNDCASFAVRSSMSTQLTQPAQIVASSSLSSQYIKDAKSQQNMAGSIQQSACRSTAFCPSMQTPTPNFHSTLTRSQPHVPFSLQAYAPPSLISNVQSLSVHCQHPQVPATAPQPVQDSQGHSSQSVVQVPIEKYPVSATGLVFDPSSNRSASSNVSGFIKSKHFQSQIPTMHITSPWHGGLYSSPTAFTANQRAYKVASQFPNHSFGYCDEPSHANTNVVTPQPVMAGGATPRSNIVPLPFNCSLSMPCGMRMSKTSNAVSLPAVTSSVIGTVGNMDLMSLPHEIALPTPLVPEVKRNSSPSIVDQINQTSPSHFRLSVSKSSTAIPLSTGLHTDLLDHTVETSSPQLPVRPAAAVAPMVQNNVTIPLANDTVLGMTAVTSQSYMGDPKVCAENDQAMPGCSSSTKPDLLSSVMDPKNFEIGEVDPVRLQKRQLRTEFKSKGINATLSPPNTADPLNRIDPHFWMNN